MTIETPNDTDQRLTDLEIKASFKQRSALLGGRYGAAS